MQPIRGVYDYRLVALSLAIAVATSYTALDLAERVSANRKRARFVWLAGGACAMGSGIWCMHYTGMLAFQLPIPIYYHLPTVAFSLLIAILASFVALFVVCFGPMTGRRAAAGSVLMGAGIATMHYSGMAAMRMQAMHSYRPFLWMGSVVLAIVISHVGLTLIARYHDRSRTRILKLIVALILGAAIASMHYTGMAAALFFAEDRTIDLSWSVDITALATFSIVVVTTLILGLAGLATLVDRQLFAQRSKLDEERAILRALIDNMPDYIYVKDIQSRFVIANPYLAHSIGVDDPERVIGKTDYDFYPRPLADAFYQDEQQIILTGTSLYNREEKSLDRTGNEIDLLTTKVPLRDEMGRVTGVAGVGRDISAIKKMEYALREAELKYRGLFDKAVFGVFQCTPDGAIFNVNPAMAFTFGYDSPAEMVDQIKDIGRQLFVDPKRGVEFMLVMDRVGGVKNFESEMFCKDGRKIWINMSIRAARQNRAVVRYEGMCDDITERKALRDQLFQAQKLESVGQLAAGIAHEINTPIQYIGDNVRFLNDAFEDLLKLLASYERLLQEAKEGSASAATIEEITAAHERAETPYLMKEIPKAIRQATDGTTRVATLVRAMKEFSHPGAKEKIRLDLNHAIESTIIVAQNEWKYVADVKTDFDASLPPVLCLPAEFNQVILNLIVNAAHTTADAVQSGRFDKGRITVRTRNCTDWAEIQIEDTGAGIPASIQTRIFDPFFTTKEIGQGTGQGLSIARSIIVKQHGGSIHFETAEGQGTTFILRLPHNGKALAATVAAAQAKSLSATNLIDHTKRPLRMTGL
jgi:PAS domain S-box-containing protein